MIKDDLEHEQKLSQKLKEEEIMVGPNPRKLVKVDIRELLLENIPSADNYEISYMHKDVVNNVITSSNLDLIISFSIDGHVKFWRKVFHLVQYLKNFKAHSGLIVGAALSKSHESLCTVGVDKTLKIFDLLNIDLRVMIKLNFAPLTCEFIPHQGYDSPLVAVSEEKSGRIKILNIDHKDQDLAKEDELNEEVIMPVESEPNLKKETSAHENVIRTLNMHKHPIRFIKMNWKRGFCVSIDERAFLQLWDPNTFDFPTSEKYQCKVETDFIQLFQSNSMPIAMNISPKGTYLVIMLKDKIIRVFNLVTGKSITTINESIKEINRIQEDSSDPNHPLFHFEEGQFQKKIGIEKDIEISKQIFNSPQLEFDESEEYLIYPSFHGIKVYSLKQKCVERILGKKEHERFIRVVLYQGKVMRNPAGSSTSSGERKGTDPTVYCTSFKKPRFYIFSKRSPEIGGQNTLVRDIVNEKTYREESQQIMQRKMTQTKNLITLHTTLGDICIQLYLEDCPKTCENFIQLARKGFYNDLIFHRVIKGFMNQTGCPKGDGTGGQSIYGRYFEDQLCPQKHRFDKPYVLAMANRGPNTNGSQFFITVVACPWLDNKHTIFGRVTRGIQTVIQINKLKTDKNEKPLINVKILSVKIE